MKKVSKGDRVRLVGSGGLLEGMEGNVEGVKEKEQEAHVVLEPCKETRWCGGNEYWVPFDLLRSA